MSKTLTLPELRKRLKASHEKTASWRKTGAEFGISSGLAYHIAIDGQEPSKTKDRLILGLPELAPAPVCPECGVVHVSSRCPAKRKAGDLFSLPVGELRRRLVGRVEA